MAHQFLHSPSAVIVQTAQGRVRGYEYDNISIFKGIPYAKAQRFHAPEPVDPWEGVLDATSFGYVCPLLEMPKPSGELFVPHRYWIMDEDCQNLNIWTPSCDDKKRPVMVWLHGGGYEAGSAIEHLAYEGENMSRRGDMVVVSINHRLNLLGYFDLSAYGEEYENSGNAGMDDIIAALRWIQENIAQFGGDPANVTLFGQSGGGGKITTLLQMPAADGLFAKGFNMSGVIHTVLPDPSGDGRELAEPLMAELGISGVKELEAVPYAAMAAAYLKIKDRLEAEGKYIGCAPYPNAHYAGDPMRVGFRKESADIPLLVSSVFGEFYAFGELPYDRNKLSAEEGISLIEQYLGKEAVKELVPVFEETYPNRRPVDILTLDNVIRPALLDYVEERCRVNEQTYTYMFDLDMPVNGGSTPWHCADIPHVFGNTELVPNTQTEGVTERIEEELFAAVAAFARTGDPNHAGIPQWDSCRPGEIRTLIVKEQTEVKCNYDTELMKAILKYREPSLNNEIVGDDVQIQH